MAVLTAFVSITQLRSMSQTSDTEQRPGSHKEGLDVAIAKFNETYKRVRDLFNVKSITKSETGPTR